MVNQVEMVDMDKDIETIKSELSTGNYETDPVTEGQHKARLFKILDTGTQEYDTGKFGLKMLKKLVYTFEILDETTSYEKDGETITKNKTISKFINFSLKGDNAKFPPFFKNVSGKTNGRYYDLVGHKVMLDVVHGKSDDGKKIYENIANVMNADAFPGFPEHTMDDVVMALSRKMFNKELYDALADTPFNNKIKETIEYQTLVNGATVTAAPASTAPKQEQPPVADEQGQVLKPLATPTPAEETPF